MPELHAARPLMEGEFLADLHIHSRFSRACSPDLTVPELAKWALLKGVGVLGTGDATHPIWLRELKETLRATGEGLFEAHGATFMLTAEVNTLYRRGDKAHQIHHLLLLPSIEAAERINRELSAFGNLALDGRPILSLEPKQLVEIVIGVEPRAMVVPAHVWTPWFGLFGSRSGFDAVEQCFEEQAKHIVALETGLSSDPAMSWRVGAASRYTLISNSDAHSARKIGREATLFTCAKRYDAMLDALRGQPGLSGTIEFFPEEGKYHLDGHRECKVRLTPEETKRHQYRCPVCKRKVTVGVMHRVDALATETVTPPTARPFMHLVPLEEIIADALEVGVQSKRVARAYHDLVAACGTEFEALLSAPEEALRRAAPERVAEGILRVRAGRVNVSPGYDGEFGVVSVFGEVDAPVPVAAAETQLSLFNG